VEEAKGIDLVLPLDIGGEGSWRNSSWSLSWPCIEFYLQEKGFKHSSGKHLSYIFFRLFEL